MIEAKKIYLASALALSIVVAGCSGDNATEKAENTKSSAPQTVQTGAPMSDNALTGTVVETFDSGGYTYIKLDNGQNEVWAAIGQAQVEKGQKISLSNGPVMKDFHSPSLNRTFSEIIFSSGVKGASAANPHGSMAATPVQNSGGSAEENFMAALTSGSATPAPAMGDAAASGGSSKAVVSAQEIKVSKAEGDNGKTVAEVFSEAGALNGKKIKVRGKVVKVSPKIMGVNWLHLQDGTGNPTQNTHDLVVTTDEMADEGSVVMVEGTVAAKKDFGMGYFYEALVEKAVISK